MMKILIRIAPLLLFVLLSIHVDAQHYTRYQRKHDKLDRRIENDQRSGKLSKEEQAKIDKREYKLHRTDRKTLRDGRVTSHEQGKLDRRYRKVKRETRRAEKH
jgi:hypothetical protein